jgi:hypothetical protein
MLGRQLQCHPSVADISAGWQCNCHPNNVGNCLLNNLCNDHNNRLCSRYIDTGIPNFQQPALTLALSRRERGP